MTLSCRVVKEALAAALQDVNPAARMQTLPLGSDHGAAVRPGRLLYTLQAISNIIKIKSVYCTFFSRNSLGTLKSLQIRQNPWHVGHAMGSSEFTGAGGTKYAALASTYAW